MNKVLGFRFWEESSDWIPIRNQRVAQAFQPVLAQAKVCGYKNNPLIATRYETLMAAPRTGWKPVPPV
jgi:hypothetical protein